MRSRTSVLKRRALLSIVCDQQSRKRASKATEQCTEARPDPTGRRTRRGGNRHMLNDAEGRAAWLFYIRVFSCMRNCVAMELAYSR